MISSDIQTAANFLRQGDVVAIPTETVYGLAANIFNEDAVRKVFELKQRPLFNPLIVHIKNETELSMIAQNIPDMAMALARKHWPGPLTLLLEKSKLIPDLITAGKTTVAVRVPDHPITLDLLNTLDFPLAAPSANPFSRISPTDPHQVETYFGEQLPFILDGGICSRGIESTIVGFPEGIPTLYRFGALSHEIIEQTTGPLAMFIHSTANPDAPGMLKKHYAPRTPGMLTNNLLKTLNERTEKKIACLCFQSKLDDSRVQAQIILSKEGDLNEAASRLYACLHWLDQQDADIILFESVPDIGIGKSINDRLNRASA